MKAAMITMVGVGVLSFMAVVGTNPSTARADTINVAYQYVEAGGTLAGTLNGHPYTDPNSADGVQKMTTANPVGSLASQLPANVWTVCMELSQNTDYPFNTYQVQTLSAALGQAKADLIGQLWGLHYNNSWQTSTPIYYGGGGHPSFLGNWNDNPAENQNALAMIYAVYGIRYNFDGTASSLTVTNSALPFYMPTDSTPATIAKVNGWLAALDLNYHGALPNLVALTSPTMQDLIVETPVVVVPEPATMAFLGLGLAAIVARRRK